MKTLLLFSVLFLMKININAQKTAATIPIDDYNSRNIRVDGSIIVDMKMITPEKFKQEISTLEATASKEKIQSIISRYKKTAENNEIGYTILKANNYLVKTALMCSSKSIRIPILCEVADKALGAMEEKFKDEMNHNLTVVLKTNLDKVLKERGQESYKELILNKDAKTFVTMLSSHTGMMEGLYNSMTDVQDHDKDIILAAMIKASDRALQNNFLEVNNTLAANKNDLATANKNITSLSRAFSRFAIENDNKLKRMVVLQSEAVQLGIENLKISKSIDNKVTFLQNFAFSRMTPEEQISALNSGILDPNISTEKKVFLLKQLEAEVKRKELNNTIGSYLNGANELVGIARNLGLNPKVVSDLQTGVNIGNAAFNAFQAFQSGNLLGAAGAVASIFGLGGRDIALERHQEIMKAFDQVFGELDEIKGELRDLKQGQQYILENQQKTYDALITINKQINDNQKTILDELDHLQNHITYNRQLILDWVKNGWLKCNEMVYQGSGRFRKEIINTQKNIIPSFKEIDKLCRTEWNANNNIDICFDLVSRISDDEGVFNVSLFDVRNGQLDTDSTNKIDFYINNVFIAATQILGEGKDFENSESQRYSSLFTPMTTVKSLDLKLISMKTNNIDISNMYTKASFIPNFKIYLWYEAVEKYTNYILNIYYYRTVIDRQKQRPHSKEDLKEALPLAGYKDLQKCLNLVEFSIAQQNLLAGDVLLPLLYSKVTKTDSINSISNARYLKMLNNNQILATNFLMYSINQEIKERSSYLSYAASFDSELPDMLQMNFNHIWNLYFTKEESTETLDEKVITIPKGWSVKLGNYYYSLPTPKDLQEGSLVYNIELQKLLSLKQNLIEELQTFEVYNDLSQNEKDTLMYYYFDGINNYTSKN